MMKFVNAEYSLDSSKILIVFSSEERVDFRQFLKEHNGCVEVVPSRSFEESGTTIEVVIIKLIKE